MATEGPDTPRRLLVIANETCASAGVVEEVRYRAGPGAAEVVVVAPALARSRLEHWLVAESQRGRAAAAERLDASVGALSAAGLSASGHLGDQDPLQALDDALRVHRPHEVIISTHPPSRSNWLERQVVRRARERYDIPITHIVVDLQAEEGGRVRSDGPAAAPDEATAERRLRLFHASAYEDAIAIREHGFRDTAFPGGTGVIATDRPQTGDKAVIFAVDVPEDAAAAFRADDDEHLYLLPADLLNRLGPPVVVGDWSE